MSLREMLNRIEKRLDDLEKDVRELRDCHERAVGAAKVIGVVWTLALLGVGVLLKELVDKL